MGVGVVSVMGVVGVIRAILFGLMAADPDRAGGP